MSEVLLIVDDNPENIRVLGGMLKSAGYLLQVARDGAEALELVAQAPPALILLDVVMPEMDGHEACRRLKADESTRAIPVIFLTARSETDEIVKGFDLGAADYVTKPFNGAELLARVRTQLALRQAQEQALETERLMTLVRAAGGAAHEINQPLQVILGRLQMLARDRSQDEDLHRTVAFLLEQVRRITATIEQMKSVQRHSTMTYRSGGEIVDFSASSCAVD